MPKIQVTSETRVTHDSNNRAVRTWFDTTAAPKAKTLFRPRDLARETLRESADLFVWRPDLRDLSDGPTVENENTVSVRFNQRFKDVRVDASEVVVNIFADGGVYSIYNHYHYDIPDDLEPKKIKVKLDQARAIVERVLGAFREHHISEGELVVYQYDRSENHDPKSDRNAPPHALVIEILENSRRESHSVPKKGEYFLAWDFTVITRAPTMNLRVLVDAITGQVINILDLAHYANGTASVFDPNPIVTSGNTGLSSGTAIGTLDAQRVAVNLNRLNAADGMGNFHLDGSLIQIEEFENPNIAEPTSAAADFTFSSNQDGFLDAMAYFHIDRFQNHIQSVLGMNNVANFAIGVDPQGLENQGDNSHYLPGTKKIAFGVRNPNAGAVFNPVADAADAMVILHEYGHAIQDNVLPGFSGFSGGVGEGFGDFLAAVFYDDKHAVPANTRGIQMSFDANTTDAGWAGRSYNKATKFDEAAFTGGGGYQRAEVWASVLFEIYRKFGGDSFYPSVKQAARDLIIRLHLMATFNVPVSGSTVADWGQQIMAADGNLSAWLSGGNPRYADKLHKKVIYDTFRRRNLTGFTALPVDVYINDGRNGGYGSLTGNDAFNENLWLENYWETQNLWARVVQYPDAATQQMGDPGDHVEPPVGSTAYLYVRVNNKGANGSGQVTVKAFHCEPGMGLVWPDDWSPMDTPSINVADIPSNTRTVVGPFPWTPTQVGHECVLAIVECANDRAVTQDLLMTDQVPHSDLVPFDNNIAQRNLAPTAAKGKMVRGFYVNNPTFETATVKLNFVSSLPAGWVYHTNVVNPDAIRLGPRQRRWVEVTIDQAAGSEVTTFDQPQQLAITGTIDGRVIGGMTFYVAPPSAFPTPTKPHDQVICPSDLFCLNIPWKDCDVEGEIDIKLRFRCKR